MRLMIHISLQQNRDSCFQHCTERERERERARESEREGRRVALEVGRLEG
jgi:hypothetical protein